MLMWSPAVLLLSMISTTYGGVKLVNKQGYVKTNKENVHIILVYLNCK
jgi:hypothetical protein